MKRYKVGTSKYWDGATVFWQTDNQNKIRTGKIMLTGIRTELRTRIGNRGGTGIVDGGVRFGIGMDRQYAGGGAG